jgi:6-phosphogluconolactonase (cycloisomerase 2 family)
MRLRLSLLTITFVAAACSDAPDMATAPTRTPTLAPSRSSGAQSVGGVFTETNAVNGNAVLAFSRATDGSLTFVGSFPTGGNGIGGTTDPLVSQYALVLSKNARTLYAVNAGSNDISVFRVGNDNSLALLQRVPSGGVRPISVTVSNSALYALNTTSNTITGFAVAGDGQLTPVPAWTRPLSAGASGGAEVRFSHDGSLLAVTERTSRSIDTYLVNGDGSLGQAIGNASSGATPFGFDFTANGTLVVSEAGGGSASSYVATNGVLTVRSASAPTLQRAPCWLVVTPDGRFAYTANAGSATLTGFAIAADGALTRLDASGITIDVGTGNTPLDLETSRDGRFLYVLKAGTGTIEAIAIGNDGALSAIGDVGVGAPRSGQMGVAAY